MMFPASKIRLGKVSCVLILLLIMKSISNGSNFRGSLNRLTQNIGGCNLKVWTNFILEVIWEEECGGREGELYVWEWERKQTVGRVADGADIAVPPALHRLLTFPILHQPYNIHSNIHLLYCILSSFIFWN